jgi:hypothetical protein
MPEAGPVHHSNLEAEHGPGSILLRVRHWKAEENEYEVFDGGCLESYYGFKREQKSRDNSD